jgi:hypothetical protein
MRFLILPVFAMLATSARAEPLTLTLTDEQKAEILADKAETPLPAPNALPPSVFTLQPADPESVPLLNSRRPHGEVGMMIGTGGARSVYGVTSVPLGDKGWATFGFENSQNVWPVPY